MGLGRVELRVPCAPTYELAKRTLKAAGWWKILYKRRKLISQQAKSRCVFSWRGRFPYVECCYDRRFGYLINSPGPGTGRSHAYHPKRNFNLFQEEENAYEDCCFGPARHFTCPLFYSLRPTCSSDNWRRRNKPRWGKL